MIAGAKGTGTSVPKINVRLLVCFTFYAYLCSVRMKVLAIQVSFLRGQAVNVTTHFKAAL